MPRFSQRHYRFVSPPADTPEQIRERWRRRHASTLAVYDREQKYPVLTPENAQDAIRFQDERIRFHEAKLREPFCGVQT